MATQDKSATHNDEQAPAIARVVINEVDGRASTQIIIGEEEGESSVSSVFTMCNSCIGAGVLSLPYAFYCAGMVQRALLPQLHQMKPAKRLSCLHHEQGGWDAFFSASPWELWKRSRCISWQSLPNATLQQHTVSWSARRLEGSCQPVSAITALGMQRYPQHCSSCLYSHLASAKLERAVRCHHDACVCRPFGHPPAVLVGLLYSVPCHHRGFFQLHHKPVYR